MSANMRLNSLSSYNMSLVNKKIAEIKLSKATVDIYRDRISDESLTGVVADFNKEFLVLSLLTEEGKSDGISVIYRGDITRIQTGGNTRTSIADLSKFYSTNVKVPKINLTSIDHILSSIQSEYGYVNIHTEALDDEVCFIGKILEQDDEWVSLKGYGTMDSRDTNELLLDKEEISRVDAGALYEESIKYLVEQADE